MNFDNFQGAQSAAVHSEVQEVQSKIHHKVQSVINDFKKVFEAAKETASRLRDELVAKSKEFFNKSEAQAREHYSKIEASFAELWKRAGKINISECKAVGQTFLKLGKDLIGTAKTCVDHTLDLSQEYMKILANLKEKIPASMSEFSNQAQKCFEKNPEGVDSQSIIECMTQVNTNFYINQNQR